MNPHLVRVLVIVSFMQSCHSVIFTCFVISFFFQVDVAASAVFFGGSSINDVTRREGKGVYDIVTVCDIEGMGLKVS